MMSSERNDHGFIQNQEWLRRVCRSRMNPYMPVGLPVDTPGFSAVQCRSNSEMRAILDAGGVGLVLMSDGFEAASAWGNPAPSISFLAVSERGCTEI